MNILVLTVPKVDFALIGAAFFFIFFKKWFLWVVIDTNFKKKWLAIEAKTHI
jgi:hypothetical protein